jgi:hypothetical protein
MAARKTAAQKAAEAAERDEYTGTPDHSRAEDAAARVEARTPANPENNLTDVKDEKTGKRLTVQQLKNKLRNEAEREVLDEHKSEVVSKTAAKYKVHNLDYVRRLTDEEKAAKAIEEYYAKFPNLRPQLEQQQAQQEQPAVVTGDQRERFDEQTVEEEGYADYPGVYDRAESGQ